MLRKIFQGLVNARFKALSSMNYELQRRCTTR